MLTLPKRIIQVLRYFEEALSERVWEWAKVLLIGAILAKGRTNSDSDFARDGLAERTAIPELSPGAQPSHLVESSPQSPPLVLVDPALCAGGCTPTVVGTDETIERRRGAKIAAKGIYRDPVRSSKEFFVKTSGLRWISIMLLAPIPWACRVWALPFFTVLAPVSAL